MLKEFLKNFDNMIAVDMFLIPVGRKYIRNANNVIHSYVYIFGIRVSKIGQWEKK